MKRLVVYNSSTGFTKQYAEWIAQDLQCEAKELKKVSKQELDAQDMVIFGGWIMGSMIMGLDKLRKVYTGKLVVFASGSNENTKEVNDLIKTTSKLGDLPFFYMQAGINFEKLGFIKRKMLSVVKNSIAKKTEKTDNDLFMEKALSGSFDVSDRKKIKPLVDYVS